MRTIYSHLAIWPIAGSVRELTVSSLELMLKCLKEHFDIFENAENKGLILQNVNICLLELDAWIKSIFRLL